MSGNQYDVGPYDADRDESRRFPRGHRLGGQRVEDLPDCDEIEQWEGR